MCRGNRRETIFEDEKDCGLFVDTLAEVCSRTGWQVCAYVLMPNHYHMVIETPEANLVTGMKWFQGTYTKRHNYRHREWGHLFQGRYKSVIIDPGDSGYFRTACDYVHLNPVRALLAGTDDTVALGEYRWSSSWYLSRPLSQTPDWLALGCIVGESTRKGVSVGIHEICS
jgi:REP element-mobilizing transposase RayT